MASSEEYKDQSKLFSKTTQPMTVSREVLAARLRELATRVMCDEGLGAIEVCVVKVGSRKYSGICRIGSVIHRPGAGGGGM